jgi:hypothetical protein
MEIVCMPHSIQPYSSFPTLLGARVLLGILCVFNIAAASAQLPADLQAKVDRYKHKLVEWAAHPTIIAAVKKANSANGASAIDNAQWEGMTDMDPPVTAILLSPSSTLVQRWEEDTGINKLYVRDKDGNLVAGSSKPLLYNVSAREAFKQAFAGNVWNSDEIKEDPTTQIKSIQISAPIKDHGVIIGVLHSAVTAE